MAKIDGVQEVSLELLKPYENNAKLHGDEQIELIANSIKEFGFLNPCLIDRDFNIIAGHGRVMASKKLGMTSVPCIFVEGLTDAQRRAYILADNRLTEMGEWDFDKVQFELEELNDMGFDVELTGFELEKDFSFDDVVEDDFEEENVETRCQLGDIWILGKHRLMCGDSTDEECVNKLTEKTKVGMAFTDPPYNVEYTGGIQFKNGLVEKNNRQMILNDDQDIYESVFRILSQFVDGACYVWFAGTKAKNVYEFAEKYGTIHSLIVWVKNGGYGALNANYKQKHEPCLYWNPKNTQLRFIGNTTETTVWEISKDGVNEYHPTQKPIALSSKAIANHEAETVLDLFGGSGSTLMACEQLNRRCYMMELDPYYCDVIINRWENFTGEKAVKL